MSLSRKRKQVSPASTSYKKPTADQVGPNQALLYIQAHEADIIRGTQAMLAAQSLEVVVSEAKPKGSRRQQVGDGLVQLGKAVEAATRKRNDKDTKIIVHDDDDDNILNEWDNQDSRGDLWVDRYDARLLLDSLPPSISAPFSAGTGSPTGWSDLPSDTEDTFFFDPDEADDYRREKRRRLMDQNREERLRALRAEDAEAGADAQEVWGGSDEEPDDAQKELMRRTAVHILSSPNSAQLEMRILANHGGDRRFAFLRGRWARSWKSISESIRTERSEQQSKKGSSSPAMGLGSLAGYGDSDGDSGDEGVGKREPEETIKQARRARAKDWAQKRRQLKAVQS